MRRFTQTSVITLIAMAATVAVQAEQIPFTLHTTGVISSSFVEDVYTAVPPPWSAPIANEGVLPGWKEASTVIGDITPTGAEVEDLILRLSFNIEGRTTSYDDDGVEEGRFDFEGSGVQAVDVNPDNVIFDADAGVFRQVFGTFRLLGEPLATTTVTNVTGTFSANPPSGEFKLYSSGWLNMQIIPELPLEEQMFPNRQPVAWVYTTAGTGHYVPEPSTFASLLSATAVGLLALRRRRSRNPEERGRV